jgi:Zc3h12a-like Ribonuclease NYN domain
MTSKGSSFELFGLMVKVPSDTVVEALVGSSTYLPKYSPKYAIPPVPETPPSLLSSQISTAPEHEITVRQSFDEMVSEQPSERTKTFVVLDCANIGWAHGENHFSAEGIRIALAFFARYNVDIAAFIPSSYLKRKPSNGSKGNSVMETDDWEQLAVLVRTGDVTVVPAGDHDDVYILSFARSNNGFIVSNDFFADHIAGIEEKSIQRSMKLWLNVNRCGFTFMKNASFMINPGNVLSIVLGHLRFQERILDFSKSQSIIINTLTSTIQVVLQLEGFMQLKYLLLARAASYMEVIL